MSHSLTPSPSSSSDLLVSHGHHFGQTVSALCNYPSLLTNGILRLEQLEDTPLEDLSTEERREHRVFEQLLDSYPDGSDEEIHHVGELIGKGAAGARGDDTKTLKSAILNWISPRGEAIQPPLHRNSKIDHGFNHELTVSLLCPAGLDWNDPLGEMLVCGDQWPIFLYANHIYDSEDPWCGLLRSHLLIYAYKHVFTSPSSVDRELKATLKVQFALSSSSVFSRTNTTTDSETFYHSFLDLLEDLEECKEVDELLTWWNWLIINIATYAANALSKIRQRRIALKQATNLDLVSS
ncbi:hypothetical protein DFH29DRAFT_982968 [Suillus ampliporus]|nr:hypothetical protein DFH29DRAFT_982968 [Suillus ampliporus]